MGTEMAVIFSFEYPVTTRRGILSSCYDSWITDNTFHNSRLFGRSASEERQAVDKGRVRVGDFLRALVTARRTITLYIKFYHLFREEILPFIYY